VRSQLSKKFQLGVGAGLGVISCYAYAIDLHVEAGYEAEYTDNTALSANNEVSEWIQTPQITVGLTEETQSVSASANYNVSREIHQNNTFSDQTTGVGNGDLTWRAIPNRLDFDLSNSSTQTTISSQGPNVPSNQQVTSTTTAGSTLTLDGPSNHMVQLHYEYAFVNAQRTDTDSQRQTSEASYIVPLSPHKSARLNITVVDVNYDSSQNPDYISQTAQVAYASAGDVIDLDSAIGYTVFDRKQQADDVKGTTGNIDVVWHVSDITNIHGGYSRSLQDQSTNITAGIPDYGQQFNDNTNLTTPYTLDATTIGISTQLGHNTVDLTGFRDDINYDGTSTTTTGTTDADQNTVGATLGAGRALRPTLRARLFTTYSTVDYKGQDRKDHNLNSGLQFDWTRWRNLTVSFGTTYEKRTSDVATDEYNEWTGTIALFYTLVGTRR
jgi:hypothetical protein